MGHPPYSPDLAPNDFFLFPNIKNKLRGQRFSSAKEAVDAFKNYIKEVSQEDWKTALINGLNECKSVFTIKENISKNNKVVFNVKFLFFHC